MRNKNIKIRKKIGNPVIMKRTTMCFTKYGLCPSGLYVLKKWLVVNLVKGKEII